MAFELRELSGSLFVNNRKTKDKHPDRTGTAMIDGKECRISGWLKNGTQGTQFLSLAFQLADDNGGDKQQGDNRTRKFDDNEAF